MVVLPLQSHRAPGSPEPPDLLSENRHGMDMLQRVEYPVFKVIQVGGYLEDDPMPSFGS